MPLFLRPACAYLNLDPLRPLCLFAASRASTFISLYNVTFGMLPPIPHSIFDAPGRPFLPDRAPRRIISLVPSQTELLYALGLDEEVVGITKFCVHPETWFRHKARIGGTKDVHPERVDSLQPDLILANKEENDREQVEALARQYPVWVSDVKTLEGALDMIRTVGALTDRQTQAASLADEIARRFAALLPAIHSSPGHPASLPRPKVAYFIWRQPWMVAGGDTFISDMLTRAGFTNFFHNASRYPTVDLPSLTGSELKHIFLSSEPYPFKEQHIREIKAILPEADIRLVDGELFSWYGSRLLIAPDYFSQLYPLCCIG